MHTPEVRMSPSGAIGSDPLGAPHCLLGIAQFSVQSNEVGIEVSPVARRQVFR
jgi:hypothetical protein